MKKALIFSLVYDQRFVGGAEIAVQEITARIAPERVSFHMITLRCDSNLPREEQVGTIRLFRVGFGKKNPSIADLSRFPLSLNKYLFPFLGCLKALMLERKYGYDVTWSIMANYAGFGALFFNFFYPKIAFILTLQEGDPIPYIKRRVRFVYPLFQRIFTRAHRVQAISHYLAGFARDMGVTVPVRVIPNGVDSAKFQTPNPKLQTEKVEALRHHLGLGEDDKILITTSRLVEKNGVGDSIESLTFLPSEVKLLVLGVGPLEEELKKRAALLGVSSRVLFLGHVQYEYIPEYLRVAHVFVRPSLSEGLGNSFIEAMAAGLPVIATPVGGIPDFLHHEETGLFCEVKNPKSIAKAVARLFADRILREKVTANARRLAHTKYNWDSITREFEEKIFTRPTA